MLALLVLLGVWLVGVADASGAPTMTGFLSKPTDQIAVPGMIAGAEITPEGDLYTGWAEYELRFGRRLTAWSQPTRTLPDPGVPMLVSTLSDGPVRYTQTVFAIAVNGRPVAYDTVAAVNSSSAPHEAQVAMAVAYTRGRQILGAHGLPTGEYRYERPVTDQPEGFYDQPGQAFDPSFTYRTAGRDLDRSGLLLARGPNSPSRALAGSGGETLSATHDARLFRALLRGHGRVSFTWQIPLDPPAAGAATDLALDSMPLARARLSLERMWSAEEAGMMRISVPEAKVSDTYRAAIAEMLSSRYETPRGWVQASNKLQYQAFWIRDGAMEIDALDLAGLHRQAAQDLAFLDSFQEPDGLFISRVDQYDGLGQALWALDQHAQLTQDPAYATAQLERIGAAIDWLSFTTSTDPLGLLPAGNPKDDELAYGHITGDDLWAAAGLRSAIADAELARRPDLVAAWQRPTSASRRHWTGRSPPRSPASATYHRSSMRLAGRIGATTTPPTPSKSLVQARPQSGQRSRGRVRTWSRAYPPTTTVKACTTTSASACSRRSLPAATARVRLPACMPSSRTRPPAITAGSGG